MKDFFSGYYYKHQKGDDVVCFIEGKTKDTKFIQVITPEFSVNLPYPNKCIFSPKQVNFEVTYNDTYVKADLQYVNLTPIKYDIMGFLKFLPTQCRHKVVSMRHNIIGSVTINDKVMDFTGGVGYIEGDSGTSFPEKYTWFQCNSFDDNTSLFGAVADVVVGCYDFKGCISVVNYLGKEYRFATYLGAKIKLCNKNCIVLKQGKMLLIAQMEDVKGHGLAAPVQGKMSRIIKEHPACKGRFRFLVDGKLLFDKSSNYVSFEYEN